MKHKKIENDPVFDAFRSSFLNIRSNSYKIAREAYFFAVGTIKENNNIFVCSTSLSEALDNLRSHVTHDATMEDQYRKLLRAKRTDEITSSNLTDPDKKNNNLRVSCLDEIWPDLNVQEYLLGGEKHLKSRYGVEVPALENIESLCESYTKQTLWKSPTYERLLVNILITCELDALLRDRYEIRISGVSIKNRFSGIFGSTENTAERFFRSVFIFNRGKISKLISEVVMFALLYMIASFLWDNSGTTIAPIVTSVIWVGVMISRRLDIDDNKQYDEYIKLVAQLFIDSSKQHYHPEILLLALDEAFRRGLRVSKYVRIILVDRISMHSEAGPILQAYGT